MYGMFSGATSFNQDLSGWNVSKVTNMSVMFFNAQAFNQNLSRWDVSKVTFMRGMFHGATAFNHELSGWDVSGVRDMTDMFRGAIAFQQDLSGWDLCRQVDGIRSMFNGATKLTAILLRTRDVSSFFQGIYYHMSPENRQRAFANIFPWPRRRDFLLFLVNHGYLYSAHVASNFDHQGDERPPCDRIFDVEDIYRSISKFL